MESEKVMNEKIDPIIWKDFSKILTPYKGDFIKLILMMVVVGALETIFPLLSKYAIDNFVEKKSTNGLISFALIYLLGIFIFSISIYLFISRAGRLETYMAYDIRKMGFEKLQLLPLSYYDTTAVGWIMSRMTSDIQRLSETISWGLVDLSWGIAMMIGVTIAMMILNYKLALIVMTVLPFVAIVSLYFQKNIKCSKRSTKNKL